MIPKTLHLYWGRNKKLSFLRYLTVYTFAKQNPDWEIRIWSTGFPCVKESWNTHEQKECIWDGKDYFQDLLLIKNVICLPIYFNYIGIREDLPEVIKSDLLRLYLLSTHGGVWSDFDILYIKPMLELNQEVDGYVCHNRKYYSIGFLIASERSITYTKLFKRALTMINETDYQSVGNKVFSAGLPIASSIFGEYKVSEIPMNTVYPIQYNELKELFGESFFTPTSFEHSIGVHWYGGSKECVWIDNNIDKDNIEMFQDCRIGRLVKELYEVKQPA